MTVDGITQQTSITGNISGAGSLNVTGGGGFSLQGANTFGGGVTMNGGSLGLFAGTGLGSGVLSLKSNAQVNYFAGLTLANAVKLNGSSGMFTGLGVTALLTGKISDGLSAGALVSDLYPA